MVAGIALVRYVPGNQLGEWALFMAIAFVLVLPIHELGHAMAGALVGFRITSVIIGVGRPLLVFKVLGVTVQIHLLPFSGMTMGLPTGGARLLRLRHWIFVAGGPAAQVLIYFVLRRVFATQFHDLRNHHLLSGKTAGSTSSSETAGTSLAGPHRPLFPPGDVPRHRVAGNPPRKTAGTSLPQHR